MSMLACARRRVQSVLPRPFAFSTVPPRQDAEILSLVTMLHKTADVVSPIIPEKNTGNSDQKLNAFRPNRVITPADLTYQARTYESRRLRKKNVAPRSATCRFNDPFYQLDLDPRDFTANPLVLSEFLSEMGKIQGRAQSVLTAKNQRLLGKTIRRAKMMGIIPHLSILNEVQNCGKFLIKRRN